MTPRIQWLVLILAALGLGVAGGEWLSRLAAFRDLAGRVAGRGYLVAIVNGKGIYETDLGGEEDLTAVEAIAAENLRKCSEAELIDPARIDRELTLLKAQFGDDKKFHAALRSDGFSDSSLRARIKRHLRETAWVEAQMAAVPAVTEQECRAVFDADRDLFIQPVRYRASHLFLAAHADTPPESVEEKEAAIADFATRLSKGESLAQLAREASEDDATVFRGGDLGYFSDARMPPEFMIELKKLRVGETSKSFRSYLGFHIVQLTELKPARTLTFEEARPEILLALASAHRAGKMALLVQNWSLNRSHDD